MTVVIRCVLLSLCFGVVVAAGMRAAEWLIPQPQMHVLVCKASDLGKIEACRSLAELSVCKP